MSWYDYPTNFTNGTAAVDGFGSFFNYANYAIDGRLGLIILLLSYIVPFLALKSSSSDKAFVGASFFGFLISILLYRIQLITFIYVAVCLILFVVSALIARSEREKIGL